MVDEVVGMTAEQARQRRQQAFANKPEKDRQREEYIKKRAQGRAPQVLADICKQISNEADQMRDLLIIHKRKENPFGEAARESEEVDLLAHEIALEELNKDPYNYTVSGSLGHQGSPWDESSWYGGYWVIKW